MSQAIATNDYLGQPLSTGRVCAVIPARGGSKGVPRKNLRPIGGESIVSRAVRTVLAVDSIDAVVVSTDDYEIADNARAAGAEVIERPLELAGDEASSESAILHALGLLAERDELPAVTVFVQATSPFIDPADVSRAVALVASGECDVAFSVTRTDAHLWRDGIDGPVGVNHNAAVRLRRQDREPEFLETGAFYVLNTRGFLEAGHRFFGHLQFVEVDPLRAIEIDTEADLRIAEALNGGRPEKESIPARAIVTDFDGVHTDDRAAVNQNGIESVTVNRSDGMGIAQLRRAGIPILILSSETNVVVQMRADKLGVDAVTGTDDKLTALRVWAAGQGLALSDIAYLGNDINDLDCLRAVGWPVVVADAQPAALDAARIVLRRRGGDGAVRELADRVLAATTKVVNGRHHHG